MRSVDGFSVDLDALAELRRQLDGAREQLDGALAALGEAAAPRLGSDDLDRACEEFRQSWAHGLGKLGECVGVVGEGIGAVGATYAQGEAAVASGFGATP